MTPSLDPYVQRVALQRARSFVEQFLPWLAAGQGKVLDFGSGLGHVASQLSEQAGRPMEYLDVRKFPFTCPGVEIKIFDGIRIPFPDKSFDSVLVISVLHHVPDPKMSLQEIFRVAGREVIICEDRVRSKKEMISEAIKDTIMNFFQPHMTMQYKLELDWEKLFAALGATIRDKKYFQTKNVFPFSHVAWRLTLD